MLEAKQKDAVTFLENSTSGSVKVTANEEITESEQDVSSESKNNVYECDQCQFKF